MFEAFFLPQTAPFAIALSVVLGLFVLEIISLLIGSSILGIDGAEADFDIDADFDVSAEFGLDADIDAPEVELDGALDAAPSGFLGWVGFNDVPFLIWLVTFLSGFGLIGLILQSLTAGIFGSAMPAILAVLIVTLPALIVTKYISGIVARIMPKTETAAMRMRFLGGHRGTITQGTAARGKPAEAKIKDRHGNFHYLRVEPLDDTETFTQGDDVTIIRKRGDRFYVI